MRRRPGFTLLEMLMCLAIIGIVCAIVIPVVIGARKRAEDARVGSQMRQLWTAMTLYMTDYDLIRPPESLDPLLADPSVRAVNRIANAPWRPADADTRPRLECPFFGDFVYMRYVQPLSRPSGWDFWAPMFSDSIPIFISMHPSFADLKGVPMNRANGGIAGLGTCSNYEPFMIKRSLRLLLSGSVKLRKHHSSDGGTYFSYFLLAVD